MFVWFRERAPIRMKMKVIFMVQSMWIVLLGTLVIQTCEPADGPRLQAIVGLVAVLSLLSFYWMSVSITAPYLATVERMEALAAGDIDSPIKHTGFKDCIGRMTVAMNVFQKTEISKRFAESAKDKTRADMGFAMSSMGYALKQLAAGNVEYRIETPFEGAMDTMRVDYNHFMVVMQDIILHIAENSQSILIGSQDILGAADDLSRRTEQQAVNLEETAAALDGITTTVRKTAEGAACARQVVESAKSDAEANVLVARDAERAMESIARSSKQIGHIIQVIDEIAARTNLLALNAGIQAARAGEAGLGFAVVASEVRELAQKSAKSAKEIKHLVSSAAVDVDAGVGLVSETGKALTRILANFSDINSVVTEIAIDARDQSVSMQEINGAVTRTDRITQQNAAMAEESTAAIHSLMQEAENLSKMLSRFNAADRLGRVLECS